MTSHDVSLAPKSSREHKSRRKQIIPVVNGDSLLRHQYTIMTFVKLCLSITPNRYHSVDIASNAKSVEWKIVREKMNKKHVVVKPGKSITFQSGEVNSSRLDLNVSPW